MAVKNDAYVLKLQPRLGNSLIRINRNQKESKRFLVLAAAYRK